MQNLFRRQPPVAPILRQNSPLVEHYKPDIYRNTAKPSTVITSNDSEPLLSDRLASEQICILMHNLEVNRQSRPFLDKNPIS
jgi:hypothetical protein